MSVYSPYPTLLEVNENIQIDEYSVVLVDPDGFHYIELVYKRKFLDEEASVQNLNYL